MEEGEGGYYLQYIPLEKYEELKKKKDKSIFNYFTVSKSGEFVVAGYEKTTGDKIISGDYTYALNSDSTSYILTQGNKLLNTEILKK